MFSQVTRKKRVATLGVPSFNRWGRRQGGKARAGRSGRKLKRIEQQTNGYYIITYYAHHPRGTNGFQKVNVSLANPELHVKARTGYSFGS